MWCLWVFFFGTVLIVSHWSWGASRVKQLQSAKGNSPGEAEDTGGEPRAASAHVTWGGLGRAPTHLL